MIKYIWEYSYKYENNILIFLSILDVTYILYFRLNHFKHYI